MARIPFQSLAQNQDVIQAPHGATPSIDGVVDSGEWEDANHVTVTVEGNDADIYFKHDRENLFIAFDIHEGHNSIFPDTRIFLDIENDKADTPQQDDFELYINPDNGGLREQQGDGSQWQQVSISHWNGAWNEDGTDHWTTEYVIQPGKLGNETENRTENKTLGIAFLVYGNVPGFYATWPDSAEMDNPSTWGDILFLDWVNETDDNGAPPPPPPPPPGNNDTNDTNSTNDVTSDDDDFLPGFTVVITITGTMFMAIVVRMKRWCR